MGGAGRAAVRAAVPAQRVPVHRAAVRAGRRGRQLDPDRAGQALHAACRQLLARALQPSGPRLHVRAGVRRVRVPRRAARGADRLERAHALGVRAELRVRRDGRRDRLRVDPVAAGRRDLLRGLHRLRGRLPGDPRLRLDAVHVRRSVHGLRARGRIGGGRAGRRRVDPRRGRRAPHHGHACFLMFVPVMTVAVLAAVLGPRRRGLRRSLGSFFRTQRGTWVPVAVISAAFLLPIVLNLARHWPGDFGKYLSYSTSAKAGGHGPRQVAAYALWFWWPHRPARLAALAAAAASGLALAVGLGLARGRLRRFLLALLAVNVVSSLAFLFYAAAEIDDLSEYYIGYFYWSAPLVTVLVIALGAVEAAGSLRRPASAFASAAAVLAAAAAFAALAVIPGARASTNDIDESLPRVVAALAARAHGRTIVLHIEHSAWVETTGFLVQAERTGVRACLDDPRFTFLVTRQFICTPAQAASGQGYWFYVPAGLPRGTPVMLRFSGIAVARAPS